MRCLVCLTLLSMLTACGDDDAAPDPDAGPMIDAGPRPDAGNPLAFLDPGTGVPGACGTPTFADEGTLRRFPYLMSMTPSSAVVAWTTTGGAPGVLQLAETTDGPWVDHWADAELFEVSRTGDEEDYVQHSVELTGLQADRDYCYRIVDGETVVADELTLHTAWDNSVHRTFTLLAFGDSGTGSFGQAYLRNELRNHDYDLMLHLGDMAYSDGTYVELERNHFRTYREFMHAQPIFPTIGNHEYKTDYGQPYFDSFVLFEQALRPEHHEHYYSFDYGDVHFVSLDSNGEMLATVSDTATDDMLDWLVSDLAASTATWKIAFMHHPPYSSGRSQSEELQMTVSPLLEAGGVDLVLVGHDHHYERTVPIRAGAAAPTDGQAIVYIVEGAGGAGLRKATGDWYTEAVADSVFSFLLFDIEGCMGHGRVIDADGAEIDNFEIDGCLD